MSQRGFLGIVLTALCTCGCIWVHLPRLAKLSAASDGGLGLRYTPPGAIGRTLSAGHTLNVDLDLLNNLSLPFKRFVHLDEETVRDFVFTMGASRNHFTEALDGMASIQKHFPDKRIFFYDLGLEQYQIQQVRRWCGVTLRGFDFSRYPGYVSNLKTYAWKVLIIQEMLTEFHGVFWMDASVRLYSNNLTSLYNQLISNGGISLMYQVGHNNYVVTHPRSYEYIPSDLDRQLETAQAAATTFMVFRTEVIYKFILHWWFLCAMLEECIAPVAKQQCTSTQRKLPEFAGCHRYDQAIINIVCSNYYNFDVSAYSIGRQVGFLKIERNPTQHYKIKLCTNRSTNLWPSSPSQAGNQSSNQVPGSDRANVTNDTP